MRLEDFIILLEVGVVLIALLFGGMAFVAFWPRPWSDLLAFARALWYRYVARSWDDLLERTADVRDYEDDRSPLERPVFANRPRTMSSVHAHEEAVPAGIGLVQPVSSADLARLARSLTEDQFIEFVLCRKRKNGEWFISGKKWFTHAGGNYNKFCEIAKRARGTSKIGDEPPTSITPIAGRVSHAQYADPDLEFEPLDV